MIPLDAGPAAPNAVRPRATDGAARDRAEFADWMADRYQALVPGLDRDRAGRLADTLLSHHADALSQPFGHPDLLWDEPAAWAMAAADLAANPMEPA